jgi:hypothetical protein
MTFALPKILSLTEFWIGGLGLAAFLTLFWVLRGAPPGQAVEVEEDQDAPRGGYRDRVVSVVCLGMLLILGGAYLAVSRGIAWSLPAFVLGFGTVLSLVMINRRYRHGSPTLRRTVDLASAALNATLFAGVLIVVNVIVYRYGGRALDLTRDQTYSLESLSRNNMKALARPVTFTTFYGRGPLAAQQLDRVRQLLELYKAANPAMVRLEHVDPDRDQGRYETLLQQAPDVKVTRGGGVVVEYGEGKTADRVVLRNGDLFEFPRAARFDPAADSFESTFKGEDALTSALIRLREAKKPKILFTTGHGEPSIEAMDNNRPGLGVWKSRLTATGAEVASDEILSKDIPDDVALVVIVGPTTPFRPEEVARLKSYTDRKKPLLVLLGETTTGLEPLLKEFNIEVAPGFAVELGQKFSFRGRPDQVLVWVINKDNTHPIVEALDGQVLWFYKASPLKLVSPAQGNAAGAGLIATALLQTTPASWAEQSPVGSVIRKDEKEEAGPLNVGVVVTDRPAPEETRPGVPRLAVFSSRNMADNPYVLAFPANLDLLMNTVSWLRGTPENMGIAPKKHVALTLTADPEVRIKLILVPTVMATLSIITLGMVTYLARRE